MTSKRSDSVGINSTRDNEGRKEKLGSRLPDKEEKEWSLWEKVSGDMTLH